MILTYETAKGYFDYEVDPTDEDYAKYFYENYVTVPKYLPINEKALFKKGAMAALKEAFYQSDALKEDFANDDGFEEFIKELYRDEAFESIE